MREKSIDTRLPTVEKMRRERERRERDTGRQNEGVRECAAATTGAKEAMSTPPLEAAAMKSPALT